MSLDRRRHVRCLCFPLEKTTFELNFSAIETACFGDTCVNFTHFMVRARLDTSPRKEDTWRIMNLFRELFQVVDVIVTKSARFVSGMLRIRSLVLMHAPI